MSKYTTVDEVVESKTEKRIRIFLAFQFFLQTFVTTLPFMQGEYPVGSGNYLTLSALKCVMNAGAFNNAGSLSLFIFGLILVLTPMVAFFFFVLDKKSKVKYLVSAICCVSCAVVISFNFAPIISIGGVITLVINLVSLFMTMQGLQATRIRQHSNV